MRTEPLNRITPPPLRMALCPLIIIILRLWVAYFILVRVVHALMLYVNFALLD